MTADEVTQLLQLKPHPLEGGFFRETYRSRWMVSGEYLPQGMSGARSVGTAIYYLITPESFSPLHKLSGTEIFHFYAGDPVLMLQLLHDGKSQMISMGNDLAAGQQPQVVVRGNVWQGCKLAPGGKWALLGTTMSPGFDPADYEHGQAEPLIQQYPSVEEKIRQYVT